MSESTGASFDPLARVGIKFLDDVVRHEATAVIFGRTPGQFHRIVGHGLHLGITWSARNVCGGES